MLLRKLGQHRGVAGIDSKTSLFTVLLLLVVDILGVTEAEALEIISQRFVRMRTASSAGVAELLALDAATDLVDAAQDQRELAKEQKDAEEDNEMAEAFMAEFSLARQRTTEAAPRVPARLKPVLPSGAIPQADVRNLVPPGSHIWRNNTGHGWAGHCPPFSRTSALNSNTGGERESIVTILQLLWRQHLRLRGLPLKQCGVLGLFPEAPVPKALAKAPGPLPGVAPKAKAKRQRNQR